MKYYSHSRINGDYRTQRDNRSMLRYFVCFDNDALKDKSTS
jgi:hypothetical protein